MNIILITILLTLLGASLVALLVWLGVVSWKSMKFIKKQKNKLELLHQVINETRISLENNLETEIINVQNHFDEVERKTDSRLDKLHDMIRKNIV
jgi:sensor domain CHASE-containing protein